MLKKLKHFNTLFQVADIKNNELVAKKKAEQKIAEIEAEISYLKEKGKSDGLFYAGKIVFDSECFELIFCCFSAQKETEANQLKLTPEYLELKKYELLGQNMKYYFGPNIPTTFFAQDAISKINQVTP